MTATILDGKAVAATVRAEVAERVAGFVQRTGRQPGLATILVGEDPASAVYVASKRKLASAAGLLDLHQHLPAGTSVAAIAAVIDALAADDAVSGILLQLPLPDAMDSGQLIDRIPVGKDVDGLTTLSAGLLARGQAGLRPCTPSGVMRILAAAGVTASGANAVVIGRSELVGRPMAQLLLEQNATVTTVHSRTRDRASHTRKADILIAAAGVSGLIGADDIKPGATVIDVGIHRTDAGLGGDVRFAECVEIAGAITPVPGGVGPMTIAMLLANTIEAAERANTRNP